MKKIFAILVASLCSLFVSADDQTDLKDLMSLADTINSINSVNNTADLTKIISTYTDLRLFQLETTPSFFKSKLSYNNTYMWYMWNNYENADSKFEKINIGERIEKINKLLYK